MTLEIDSFLNEGYGWECKLCRAAPPAETSSDGLPRFYLEGEAENKETTFTEPARARWRDAAQQILYCPICLTEETVNKA